jgi:hypothetical protein
MNDESPEDDMPPHLTAKSGFGEISSPDAQQFFRNTILAVAKCPICGNAGLEHLRLTGHQEDGETAELTFGLPVIVPGKIELLPVGALQMGMCRNCGFLAPFMDIVVRGRYEALLEAKK